MVAAKAAAARSLNLVSRVGGATLKVRNAIKKQPVVAIAKATKKAPPHAYRILDLSDGTTTATDATAPAVTETFTADASNDATITVSASDSSGAQANPETEQVMVTSASTTTDASGDTVVAAAESIPTDTISNETGSQTYRVIEEASGVASGSVMSGGLDYLPDATAVAEGQSNEFIDFTVPPANLSDGDVATVSVAIATDASFADNANATCTESFNESSGDLTATGSITMPGSTLTMTTTTHTDGTEDLLGVSSAFWFGIYGLGLEGTGFGSVYDRDPSDPNAVQLGIITVINNSCTITFFKDDGTLDTPQPSFELLR